MLAAGAAGAAVAFRAGVLPGGLVGVDVALALFGWWLAGAVAAGAPLAELLGLVWRRLWPPVLAAILLAVVWVWFVPSTRLDTVVRGQALAVFGGYGNWHLLAVGPLESPERRLFTPLQHLWPLGVAVQLVVLFALAAAASRPRARRRPEHRDPLVLVCAALAVGSALVSIVQMLLGASGQGVLLTPAAHGVAFFGAASFGAVARGPLADGLRALALGTRWIAVALLVGVALFASPESTWWPSGVAVVGSVLAVVVVAGWVPWPPGRVSHARPPAIDPWMAIVSFWILQAPAAALAAPSLTGLPSVVAAIAGLAFGALLAVGVTLGASRLSLAPEALERRQVLVPPLVVLLLVLVLSSTGAFHWERPHPRPGAAPAAGGS